MAPICRYPLVSHAASSTTRAPIQVRNGHLVNQGVGASFWFRPLGTALSEVPVDDLEFGTIFRVATSDRQDISVQIALTLRISKPELAASRLDSAVNLRTGQWSGQPLQALQARLSEMAQQCAACLVAKTLLREVLDSGLELIQDGIRERLAGDEDLLRVGIRIAGVRVIAVRADEEVERALQAKIREAIQAEADRATYERRAQAVELERAIKENELNNRTELARQDADLVELVGANEGRRAEQEIEREQLRVRAEIDRRRFDIDVRVDEIHWIAEAEKQRADETAECLFGSRVSAVIAAIAPEALAALP